MKAVAFLVAGLIASLTSLILIIALLSTPGGMASTTYSTTADNTILMVSIGHGHALKTGDWAFCLNAGYVGRVKAVAGDMAACEKYFSVRDISFGGVFRLF